jgi:hypothetical protein
MLTGINKRINFNEQWLIYPNLTSGYFTVQSNKINNAISIINKLIIAYSAARKARRRIINFIYPYYMLTVEHLYLKGLRDSILFADTKV